MLKLLLTFILSVPIWGFTQVKLSVKIINGKENTFHLDFTIYNNTDDKIIIPLDTLGFKTYMSEDHCTDFYQIMGYPDLGILPMIKDENGNFIESMLQNSGRLDSEGVLFYSKKAKKYNENKKIILRKWIKKNHFYDKNINWVKKNHYLFNHLLFLNPHQKISFTKSLNLYQINKSRDIPYYNFYPLNNNINYTMFFRICIDKNIYKYLTIEQKKKMKNYTLFNGKISSNNIKLLW